jgi:hypothetical protein
MGQEHMDDYPESANGDDDRITPVMVNNNENFINNKWRPMMAWTYMAVIIADFILFPIGWSALQAWQGTFVMDQWEPLTLLGGGLFHVAIGAVLGVTAYGRTREKLEGRAGFHDIN